VDCAGTGTGAGVTSGENSDKDLQCNLPLDRDINIVLRGKEKFEKDLLEMCKETEKKIF